MRALEVLAGNPALKRRLQGGRGLSHAYLLTGAAGCGKRTLAGWLAAALVCSGAGEAPCGACPDCRKAAGGIHPDITRLGGGGKPIAVAQVRDMRADAYVRPNEAPRKVYVLEDAQDMNESAQNALLKLLEDGPPYAAFLLLSERAGSILPTVRSRCEQLSLAPVTAAEAEGWLLSRYPDRPRDEVLAAAARCEGVLGRAVSLLEGGPSGAEARRAAERLTGALLSRREGEALACAVELEKWDREALGELLDEGVALLWDGLRSGGARRAGLALVRRYEAARRALSSNAGAGHVAGALVADWFSRPVG